MTDHDELRLSLGAYALGTLEPDDRERVRRHLEQCPRCVEELEQLAPLPEFVALTRATGATETDPSPLLEDRVLAGYRIAAAPPRRRRLWLPRLRLVLPSIALGAVAAIALVVVFGGADDGTRVELASVVPGSRNTATARIEATASGSRIALDARLAPSRRGEVYELWLVGPRGRVSGGTFRVGADGRARMTLSAGVGLEGVQRVGITREPDAIDPTRNGPTVMVGQLT